MVERRVDLADWSGRVVQRDVPVRQCAEGLDASPAAYAHHPHTWEYRGMVRWCRGWFPLVSCKAEPIVFKLGAAS